MKAAAILTGLFLIHSASSAGSPKVPLTPEGMHAFVRISSLAVSADGKWVVSARSAWDPKTDKKGKLLWLTPLGGEGSERALTGDPKTPIKVSGSVPAKVQDDNPQFSPDGQTVAFISNRSGSSQIWMVPVAGGEPKQLTTFPVDVDHLKWSPRGNFLSFSAKVHPETSSFEASVAREKQLNTERGDALLFDHLMVRHWDTWEDGKRQHLFILPIVKAPDWKLAGAPVDLMAGIDGDAPSLPFGDSSEYSWSPDEAEFAYSSQIGPDKAWTLDGNIYLVDLKSPKPKSAMATKCLSCENLALDALPAYSPDGRWLAYLAMKRPGFEADRARVVLVDRKTLEKKILTEDWDRSAHSLEWSSDSRRIFLTADEGGRRKIFSLALDGGIQTEVEEATNTEVVAPPSNSLSDGLIFLQNSFSSPAEIFYLDRRLKKGTQLTGVNRVAKDSVAWSSPEEFFFDGAKGEKVQGWLFKPVGFQEGRRYPVTVIIHGGPQAAWNDHFNFRWNAQLFASAGYGVVIINFHGTPGFGQKFTDAVSGDWGGAPYEDIMRGLDFALAKNSWMDPNRVAALGASYGGYLINWINGHTDRFKCLVNHDGLFDTVAAYYTTDELYFKEWEMRGTPWESKELYERFNPAKFIANWKTPTLVIQGGKDYRVTETNALSTFTVLQRKKIPSQLLYFPGENHWVLKPKNSLLWYKTVFEWLRKWVGDK